MNQKYPTGAEILTSIRNPNIFFKEEFLKKGTPIKYGTRIMQYSGAYGAVFPFETSIGKKAIRVWTCELNNARERTQMISQCLKKLNSEYFVDFDYKDDALLINGTYYPIVVMDWVEGMELKEYIEKNINNKSKLAILACEFKKMVNFLHVNNLSHGDLQHRNIMITNKGKMLLVDYDSFYVPGMESFTDSIKGLPGYQHPQREELKYLSHKADYFSELIIYLSIITYAEDKTLWNEGTEYLLFSKEDIDGYKTSAVIKKLSVSKNKEISQLAGNLLEFLKKSDITQLKPLEDLLVDPKEQLANKVFDGFKKNDVQKKPKTPPPLVRSKISDVFSDVKPSKKEVKLTKMPNIDSFEFK